MNQPDAASLRIAQRMNDIAPFQVMEVQRRALELDAQGRRVIHMEIGQPDFGAPLPIVEAGIAAMRQTRLAYTDALGLPALREALARFYENRHGIALDPARIIVTPGASGAFLIAMGTLLNPGDEVLMPDPSYPCTRHFVRMFEGQPTMLPVEAAQRYQPTAADIARAWRERTRGIVLASPSNPTGTAILAEELSCIAATVRARNGFMLVDEIYQGLTYDAPPATALAVADDCLVVNSFSKYFCMTGWRLGWMIAPEALVRDMERFAQNAFICASAPAQHAALAAFEPQTLAMLEERREAFHRRRDFLVPALRALGFSIPVLPDGAFYVYAGCEHFCADSRDFAWGLLESAGVAVTPGCDFGTHRADMHLRFAYTRSIEELEEGTERIARYIGSR
jgi:aspartate/methionine/tyrosine aminotransferase